MKTTLLTTLLLIMVVGLSSCGGGGSSPNPTPGPVNDSLIITVTPVVSSLPANTLGWPHFIGSPFETQVTVRVEFANGQGVATGVITHMQTNNTSVAYVGIPDDPSTDDVNEYAQGYVGVNQETIGSNASYFIRSDVDTGEMSFTISATHPTTGRNYEKNLNFTVSQGPDPTVTRLEVLTPRTDLPVNDQNVEYFPGTPFMMETDIQVRDIFGNLTNPAVNDAGNAVVNVSINPSNVLYFTTLDDPETDVNEFLLPLAQGTVNMNSGHGTLYLWSRSIPGSATVTVSAIEAGSGANLNYEFVIDVVNGIDPTLPTSLTLNNSGGSLYIQGSGGVITQSLNATVISGTLPVLDPQVNNIQLSIVTDGANSGEKISGIDFSGTAVEGATINLATVNGIANALVHSGTNTNTISVTATVDRLDNNVDNGIQDGLSATTQYAVSDGVLWALELTSPSLDSLTVNADTDAEGEINYQDGTYSLIISAQGTDKAGNPALPQTVNFGMINSPIVGYPESGAGTFVHSSDDGDPQEGGSGFTSASGNFVTAAGGVQPADTLVVFGEESLGNEDLESAVTVATINSQTSLSIDSNFNRNDESGSIDNNLGILPYAIGRAVDGNITASADLNEFGVATTTLNYPVSQLGRIAAVFVTGHGGVSDGVAKVVTDVEMTAFPGVEGFNDQSSTLVVSPNRIPGNVNNIGFVVCLADSARNPLPGRAISFNFVGPSGSGIIDGQTNSGVLTQATGSNGCASGVVATTGILPGGSASDTGFNFFSGNLTCDQAICMEVVPAENGVLNANPSSFIGRGSVPITLTLYDASGNPIEGAAISGSCSQVSGGSLGITSGPSVTNASGQSSVSVSVALDAPDGGLDGTCDFAVAGGNPSVTVNFSGGDSCLLGTPSPPPPVDACD
ncbi:MAG: hypothetical protein L3J53_03230 [Proteobacteria bacterium]|nr:hypothetical protein [Pseudomonadota bacterium]